MKKSKQVFLFFRHLLNNLMNQNFFGFEKVKHFFYENILNSLCFLKIFINLFLIKIFFNNLNLK